MKRKIRFDVELRPLWCLTKMNLSGEDIARKPIRRTYRLTGVLIRRYDEYTK